MTSEPTQAFDTRDLRRAFGSFATGVTIVTTVDGDGEALGFTANSFSSVSIEPPLLLVNIAKSAHGLEAFTQSKGFAVNILAHRQRELSNRFATAGADKFADLNWKSAVTGSPLIDDVVAWFDCSHFQQVDAGDHIVLIGEVQQYAHNTHAPLGFCRGAYVSFGLSPQMLQLVSSPGLLKVGAIVESEGRILLERNSATGQLQLPAVDSVDDAAVADNLVNKLASEGIEVELPFIYAAYHDDKARYVYYLGEIRSLVQPSGRKNMQFYAYDCVTWEEINDSAVMTMLERYIHEKRLGNYSTYIGSVAGGEVYPR
ncbi:MAG: flavin reductase (DIM6/NTAB) family NADH-FMN oxidoreductase RutF [Planctomycetota bacterium]|jgi:flavin reductase (DIM6/NTAB) family NADH-FMN oxidoreductase RutF